MVDLFHVPDESGTNDRLKPVLHHAFPLLAKTLKPYV